jgi:DUF1365 family protein
VRAAPSDLAAGELQRSADRVRIERLGAQALRRCELTRTTMTTVPLSHPPQVIAAIARIYCNALRLRLRGAPVFPGLRANTRKGLVPRLVHKKVRSASMQRWPSFSAPRTCQTARRLIRQIH